MMLLSLEDVSTVRRNRGRVEILARILDVAQRGALKTHIMYKANMSHNQLGKYLTFLKTKGLLEEVEEPDERFFRVTDQGVRFLKDYARIRSYLD